MGVTISSGLLARLIAEAEESPDAEICGLLFGTPDRIEDAVTCANVAANPARNFEIDPSALFAAHRHARGGGRAVIGHYHSHPSGSAEPSPRDAAQAMGDGALWLIIGGIARLWRSVVEGAFVEETLSIDRGDTAMAIDDAHGTGDWRAARLAQVRDLIRQAAPDAVEEVKWRKPSNPAGVSVWSHSGILCTGETYKDKVKLTCARGAELDGPGSLFNAGLDGGTRRAIDLREHDRLDPDAFKALIRAAVALNAGA